jgi:hypothetical protein
MNKWQNDSSDGFVRWGNSRKNFFFFMKKFYGNARKDSNGIITIINIMVLNFEYLPKNQSSDD